MTNALDSGPATAAAQRRAVRHVVAALQAALSRVAALEAVLLSGDGALIAREAAAIREARVGTDREEA